MNSTLPIKPDYCASPGDFLMDTLEDLNMPQTELAARTGLTPKTINAIIKAKVAITPETAQRLEVATSISAQMWLNMERVYREWLSFEQLKLDKERVAQAQQFLKDVPYSDLVKRGYCRSYTHAIYKERDVLEFFGVMGIEEYEQVYGTIAGAARVGYSTSWNDKAFAAWIRIGELMARNAQAEDFDADRLKVVVREIRALVNQNPGKVWGRVTELLKQAGVIAVMVPELTGTHVAGFTRFVPRGKRAIVELSLRGKRVGSFWFNLFHELAHLLKHSKKKAFINRGSDEQGKSQDAAEDPDEREADKFSRDMLIAPDDWKQFIAQRHFTAQRVRDFARQIGVCVDIVLGRIHQEKLLPYTYLDNLKQFIDEKDFGLKPIA